LPGSGQEGARAEFCSCLDNRTCQCATASALNFRKVDREIRTDMERFALRNLLAKTIETSRHPRSRRILTLKAILAKLVPILAPSSRSHPAHEH